MSLGYAKKNGGMEAVRTEEMRKHCQRPGKVDEKGKLVYFTEQSHMKECDVNLILKRFDKTGLITHVQKMEARFGDVTGMEFKEMQDRVAEAKSVFAELPSKVRARFDNNVEKLLEFMEHPENRDEAIKLGLIDKQTAPERDGLGEHITDPVPPDSKNKENETETG